MRDVPRWFPRVVLLLSMLCGNCSTARGNEAPSTTGDADPSQTEVPRDTHVYETRVDALLAPLEAACFDATGEKLNASGVCMCPDAGSFFFVDHQSQRGVCSRASATAPADNNATALRSSVDGWHKVVRFAGDASYVGTVLKVRPSGSRREDRELADWMRGFERWQDRPTPTLWYPLQFTNELYVQVGVPQDLPSMDDLMAGTLQAQPRKNGDQHFRTFMVEPEVRFLDAVLGVKSLSPEERVRLFQHDIQLGADQSIAKDLLAAYDDIVGRDKEVRFASGAPLFGKDCTNDCVLLSAPLHVALEAQVVVERIYSSGSLAREAMWYRRDGELRALLLLGPSRVPGLIMLIDPRIAPNFAGGVVRLYDRQWNSIGTYDVELPNHFGKLAELQRGNAPIARDEPALLMCEPDMRAVMADMALAPSIAFGPHLPVFFGDSLQHGSLFGWLKNASGRIDHYLQGYAQRTLGVFARPWFSDAGMAMHGHHVVAAAIESGPQLRIIPIGAYLSCFSNYSQWHTSLAETSRVVNASFEEAMLPGACKAQILPVLRESERSTLWVVGAGNGDHIPPFATPDTHCPGSLSGEKNLLVVAGSTGDGLHPNSMRGQEYADIAAPWNIKDGTDAGGTSLSSPRVAAVAAELASHYPALTPEALRLILLASSRTTSGTMNTVRSGGILDGEAAFSLGPCVGDSLASGYAFSPGLLEICMLQAGFNENWAVEKMSMLYDRGAFRAPE